LRRPIQRSGVGRSWRRARFVAPLLPTATPPLPPPPLLPDCRCVGQLSAGSRVFFMTGVWWLDFVAGSSWLDSQRLHAKAFLLFTHCVPLIGRGGRGVGGRPASPCLTHPLFGLTGAGNRLPQIPKDSFLCADLPWQGPWNCLHNFSDCFHRRGAARDHHPAC